MHVWMCTDNPRRGVDNFLRGNDDVYTNLEPFICN